MNDLIEVKAGELVSLDEGRVTTNTLLIAETFEKRHKDVLRSIGLLFKKQPEFAQPNFGLLYENNTLNNNQPVKYYSVTEAGFAILAMSFTGEKALGFKIAYINAFEAMRHHLSKQNGLKLLPNQTQQAKDSEALSTVARRQHSALMDLVGHGIATYKVEDRPCWFYKLTDHGKSLGYTTNKNGTILPPKEPQL